MSRHVRGNRARTRKYRGVDEVVVLRVVQNGDPLPIGYDERAIAVAKLTAAGKSSRQIAEQLGCSDRTVTRARTRLKREAA